MYILKKVKDNFILLNPEKRTPNLTEKDIVIDEYGNVGKFVDTSEAGLGYGNFRKVLASSDPIGDLPFLDYNHIRNIIKSDQPSAHGLAEEYASSKEVVSGIVVPGVSDLAKEVVARHFLHGYAKNQDVRRENKYTLDDINKAIAFGFEQCKKFGDITKPERSDFIESLSEEQSEWAVEVETETVKQLVNGYKNQPKDVIGFVAAYETTVKPKVISNYINVLKIILNPALA